MKRAIAATAVCLSISAWSAADEGFTRRVSVSSTGAEGKGPATAYHGHISADGRYVTFISSSPELVAKDTNGLTDVFVHDAWTGRTERVSVGARGTQATHVCWRLYPGSLDPSISADGRYVAFASSAENLVPNDTNCQPDVFVHDRSTRKTQRVSLDTRGRDANQWSGVPSLSADGLKIAFWSEASNLVAGDTNGFQDVFVRDLATRKTRRVSRSTAGEQGNAHSGGPALSANGRYVAFGSAASNLAPLDDTNGLGDIFLHDLRTGRTTLVSSEWSGFSGNAASFDLNYWYNFRPAVSEDGRYVAFTSHATDLVGWDFNSSADVFIRDMRTQTTRWADLDSYGQLGNYGHSYRPALSPDGRYVAFVSEARNFVPLDLGHNAQTHIYLRDLGTGRTSALSLSSDGLLGDRLSTSPGISADGRVAAFQSEATNLVLKDGNGIPDIFVRDRALDATRVADISVTQAVAPTTVARGQTLAYSVTVRNGGPAVATGLTLIDVPSSRGTVVSLAPTRGKCTGNSVIVCRVGNLAVGQEVGLVVTLKAVTAGSLSNRIAAQAAGFDASRLDNVSEKNVTVTP